MRARELQDRIVARLVREQGGSTKRWRLALGPLPILDPAKHPDVDRSIEPCGPARENSVIGQVLDDVRMTHSVVKPDRGTRAEDRAPGRIVRTGRTSGALLPVTGGMPLYRSRRATLTPVRRGALMDLDR